jgi:hypothetical protein
MFYQKQEYRSRIETCFIQIKICCYVMSQNSYYSISVNATMECNTVSVRVCNDTSTCSVSLVPVASYAGFHGRRVKWRMRRETFL